MPNISLSVCFVCLPICLFICKLVQKLLNRSSRKFDHIYICAQGRTDKILEVTRLPIRIQEFLKVLQHCEIWHFSTIWLISRESDRILMKILTRCILRQRSSPRNFGSNPDPQSGIWIRIWTRIQTRFFLAWCTFSDCSCLLLRQRPAI